jgi:hypothetical protein
VVARLPLRLLLMEQMQQQTQAAVLVVVGMDLPQVMADQELLL